MRRSCPLRPFAFRALTRIADGKPAFERPAQSKSSLFWRAVAIRELREGGYIAPGKWAPIATKAGFDLIRDYSGPLDAWPDARKRRFLEAYAGEGPAAAAERFGISRRHATFIARRFGARVRPWRPWTDRDIAELKARYPLEGPDSLAGDLDRTRAAVKRQAGILRLRFVAYGTARPRNPATEPRPNA